MTVDAQRHDDGRHAEKRDPKPVQRTHQRSTDEDEWDGVDQRTILAAGHQRHQHGGAGQHPGYGKVDSPADDHQRLPQRDQTCEGGQHRETTEVRRRQEAGR